MGQPHPDPSPEWLDRGRIPGLDGLRAVAVVLVCLCHAQQTHGFPDLRPVREVLGLGGVGVDVFFVLSGFLITTLLCREQRRTGRVSLRDFYIRRAFRILPAYVGYLGFVAVLTWAGAVAAPAVRDWVAAATYTVNFLSRPRWELGHIWSLSIEEHFYLGWPLLFIALPRRPGVGFLVGVLAVGAVLRWAVLLGWPAWSKMTDLWTFTRLDSIAAGCLLALLVRTPGGVRRLDRWARAWPLALVLLGFGLVAARMSGKVSVGVTPTITALTLAVLVWAAARRTPRWLEWRAVVAVGAGSYSLYLWQQPFLNPYSDGWWAAFPQNLGLAGLAAAASYNLLEWPFLRLKDRLHPRPAAAPAPGPHGARPRP